MSATNRALSLSSLCVFLLTISTLATPSTSAIDSFVFGGCSQLKYMPGSPYENNVNSILTSLVNSAMFTSYNNFTTVGTIGTTSSNPQDTVSGLFQCRGDLQPSDCARCVARAVTQLGTLCIDSCGGALQLDGCLVKYDNATFLGVEDKTVVLKKCGPPVSYDSNSLAGRDAVLASLGAGDGGPYKTFRTGTSGNLQGVAQCVGDLSPSECTDCLADAIGRLKTECGPAAWGDMFLAKCYVRFSEGGVHSHGGKDDGGDTNTNDDEVEKTLAIIIGLIAAVALFIVFISFLNKLCEKGKGGK